MSLADALTLTAIIIVLAAVPSASTVLVVTRSAAAGLSNGIAVAAGIVSGDLVFALLALAGMTALTDVLQNLFVVLRYAGGVYLVWLGFTLLTRERAEAQLSNRNELGCSSDFLAGLLLTLGDVKAIFFYASLFPGFVNLSSPGTADVIAVVGVTLLAVGGVKVLYACGAARIVAISGGLAWARPVKPLAACVLVTTGVYLVVKV